MNKYPEIIKLVLENARASGKTEISLVNVIEEYDAIHKLAILIEEVNEALTQIKGITVKKEGKELFFIFTSNNTQTIQVDNESFRWADNEYRKRFAKRYKELRKKSQ